MKTTKKIFIYCLGMFLIAVGVSLSIKSQLGISPVNAIPYVISLFTGIEQGIIIIIFYLVLILIQVLLLRKDYNPLNVLQILFSTMFGYFVTLTNWIFQFESPEIYIFKIILLFISMIFISIGVILYLKANIIPMPPEGLILALNKKTEVEFHRIKITADFVMVITAVVISLIFIKKIIGVREGTILAAFFIGKIIGFIEVKFKNQIIKLEEFLK